MAESAANEIPEISVAEFVTTAPHELEPEVVAGPEFLSSRTISSERIQKLGLALNRLYRLSSQGKDQDHREE
jgi:hypothetical protein